MIEGRGAKAAVCALVAVLVLLIAVGVIYYNKVYIPSFEQDAAESTSYSPRKNTPQRAGTRTRIAQDSRNHIELYKDGDFIILVHNGAETEYTDWAENFGSIQTDLYYGDYNDDGLDDIIVLDVEGEDEDTGLPLHGLYVLAAEGSGETLSYKVNYISSADWKNMFNEIVNCYLNQPQAYPRLLQFVMDYTGESVPINSDTGLVADDHTAWYTNVLRSESGEYYTLDSLSTGPAVFEYDAGSQFANAYINIYAVYTNGETQLIGSIESGISLAEDGFSIRRQSVSFEPESSVAADAPQR